MDICVLQPFNPLVGLLTILREARKWWNLAIENEGDLIGHVIEKPQDLDGLKFKWSSISFDMGNDGLAGSPSEAALDSHMDFLSNSLPELRDVTITLFPTPMVSLYSCKVKQILYSIYIVYCSIMNESFPITGLLDFAWSTDNSSWSKSCLKTPANKVSSLSSISSYQGCRTFRENYWTRNFHFRAFTDTAGSSSCSQVY